MMRFVKFVEKIVMRGRVRRQAAEAAARLEQDAKYRADMEQIDAIYSRIEARQPPRQPVANGTSNG